MTNDNFSFDEFLKRSSLELGAYMEPLLATSTFEAPAGVVERIISELSHYDESHLVYGLLLCFRLAPASIVPKLPEFLMHSKDSVFTTALNLLDAAPSECVSDDLVRGVRAAEGPESEKPYLEALARRLEDKLRGVR